MIVWLREGGGEEGAGIEKMACKGWLTDGTMRAKT